MLLHIQPFKLSAWHCAELNKKNFTITFTQTNSHSHTKLQWLTDLCFLETMVWCSSDHMCYLFVCCCLYASTGGKKQQCFCQLLPSVLLIVSHLH